MRVIEMCFLARRNMRIVYICICIFPMQPLLHEGGPSFLRPRHVMAIFVRVKNRKMLQVMY